MPRLPKLKTPAVSTPTSPPELAQRVRSLPQGDSRALPALSTAIALSIGSPFYGIHDTLSDRGTIQGRDTSWQTAYSAARVAVEITKESSDMFLPLKAVTGAMSVLIKNYDVGVFFQLCGHLLILYLFLFQQTSDNTKVVDEIEQRVQSLSGVLASPVSVDDYAEKGRRVELWRFVPI